MMSEAFYNEYLHQSSNQTLCPACSKRLLNNPKKFILAKIGDKDWAGFCDSKCLNYYAELEDITLAGDLDVVGTGPKRKVRSSMTQVDIQPLEKQE